MKTVLLDCDGVIVDLASVVHRTAKKLLGRKLPPPADWKSYDFDVALKLTRNEKEFLQRRLLVANNLGWKADFYPGAASFIEYLATNNRVVFVTTPWPGLDHWVEARMSLLQPYLSRRKFDIVFCADKSLVNGDWLIDDKVENVTSVGEKGILFSQPWNEGYENTVANVAKSYTDVIEIVK